MNENIEVFDIANELIIIPKAVIDTFLKERNPADLIALYSFYYYTAKWQKTNQPKCSTSYTSKGLHWNKDKVRRVKNQLKNIGLVKDVKQIDDKTRKIKGWYIKVNYIFKRETVEKAQDNHPPQKPEGGNSHSVENRGTNALSSNNLNALSSNNKKAFNPFDYINSRDDLTQKARSMLHEWLEYKQEIKAQYKTQKGIDKLLKMLYDYTEAEIQAAIDNSIANNYKGLFPKRTKQKTSQNMEAYNF